MHKIKLAALMSLAILFGGMFSGAVAQKRMPPQPVEPPIVALNGIYKVGVDASELSSGVTDSSGTTYGWTWNGKTDGDLSGFIFLSLNWTPERSVIDLEVLPSGPTGKITGGSWSKLIFMKGEYVGSISGTIVSGELNWNEKYQIGTVSLQMTADKGTDLFTGCVGTATFEGILDQRAKQPTLSGTLFLNY